MTVISGQWKELVGIILFSLAAIVIGYAQSVPELPKEAFIEQQISEYENTSDMAQKYERARQLYRYFRFEDLERAKEYIELSLEHARALEDPVRIIYAYTELGSAYSELGDYEAAFQEYSAAFTMGSVSNITSEIFHTNYHLGKTYFDIQLPALSEPLLRSALDNYIDERILWIPKYDLAVLYATIGDSARAKKLFEELESSIYTFEKEDEISDMQQTILLAELMIEMGEFSKAENLMNARQPTFQQLDLCFFNGLLSLNRSRIAMNNNNSQLALELALSAYADFNAHQDESYIRKTLLHLSEVYAALNDFEQSYLYLNEYHQHLELARLQQSSAIVSRLISESEATAEAELELQRLNEVLQMRNVYNTALLVLLIAVVVLLVFWFRVYQKRKEVTKQLEDLNTDKNHFIGVVSHDLRSPLNSVMVLSEFMKDDPEMVDADTAREYGSIIYNSTLQMQHLLNNMLDVNKIESQSAKISTKELSIEPILKSAYTTLSVLGKEKDINTTLEIDGSLTNIMGDENAIYRILENLVNNAFKFSSKESCVKITAREVGTQVEIAVADQGPGLTELDKTKLFKKFEKLSASPTANEKSTGLGLYIVKNLVQQMEGTILVESEQGKGTTFKVLLNKAQF